MHRAVTSRRRSRAISSATTSASGERAAVDELLQQIPRGDAGFAVFFCTPHYDLGKLGHALRAAGRVRAIAAATGRAIGSDGFLRQGITGFHLPAGRFKVADAIIDRAAEFGLPEARDLARSLRARLGRNIAATLPHLFGLLLVDAEARCEERLIAALGTELGGVPIVGGSAGDLYFDPRGPKPGTTRLLHRGVARRGAAVFCLIASATPLQAVSHTHYVPDRRRRVVITEADPSRRLVLEINGRKALQAYTEAAGLKRTPRLAGECAPHPLMIRIGGQYFARGVQRIYADGSLEFACAMEPGMVLTVARPGEMVAELNEMFNAMRRAIGPAELVVGFECAARTAEMEQSGLTDAVSKVFRDNAVVGFSTLGEQFNTIHANNSFTCVGLATEDAV